MELISIIINIVVYIFSILACVEVGGSKNRFGLLYGIFLGPIGLIILTFLDPKGEIDKGDQPISSNKFQKIETRKCPFCTKDMIGEIKFCPHCGNNIQEYDNKQKMNNEDKRQEFKERYKTIEEFFNDEVIMKEAKKLRRMYSKSVYISFLKDKAKELGLGEIEINEDDVE